MLSDRKHWSVVGFALLASVSGMLTDQARGQIPEFNVDTPGSYSFPGPAPQGLESSYGCDSYGCGSYSTPRQPLLGGGLLRSHFGTLFGGSKSGYSGSGSLHGDAYGAYSGTSDDGLLGNGPLSRCLAGTVPGGGCGGDACCLGGGLAAGLGGAGCASCGGTGLASCLSGGNGSIFSGRILSHLLGPLAPYSDGTGSQRWFDVYAGTIAFARKSSFGGFSSAVQDLAQTTPVFEETDIVSTLGISGTPVLRTTDLNFDELRYGLELIGNIQTGPGSNVEVRYFGLNNWNDTRRATSNDPNLFSVFSVYGTDPGGIDPGFDDTDRSFIHQISYDSKFDNGEVNYHRRWMGYISAIQGSWFGGIRYFELDEDFGFSAVGSFDNTFTFDQLRFFNMDTQTRNQLVGVQLGGNIWVNLIPGIAIGNEVRAGIYNNHSKVETFVYANSVPGGPLEPGASEVLRKDAAAFVVEYSAQAVYRLTYSWSVRGAYNLLYVDQVALAPENFNARDMTNALPNSVFGPNRHAFINADGHALYHGFSVGAEFLW